MVWEVRTSSSLRNASGHFGSSCFARCRAASLEAFAPGGAARRPRLPLAPCPCPSAPVARTAAAPAAACVRNRRRGCYRRVAARGVFFKSSLLCVRNLFHGAKGCGTPTPRPPPTGRARVQDAALNGVPPDTPGTASSGPPACAAAPCASGRLQGGPKTCVRRRRPPRRESCPGRLRRRPGRATLLADIFSGFSPRKLKTCNGESCNL